MVKIGSMLELSRFDGNGIPDKWLVTDIFRTKMRKIYVETTRGLIDWNTKRLVVIYINEGSPEAYSYVSNEYQIDPDVMFNL